MSDRDRAFVHAWLDALLDRRGACVARTVDYYLNLDKKYRWLTQSGK